MNGISVFKHTMLKPVFFMSDRGCVDKRSTFTQDNSIYVFSSSVEDDVNY